MIVSCHFAVLAPASVGIFLVFFGYEIIAIFGCEATGRQRPGVGVRRRERSSGIDGDCRTNRMQRTPR